MPLSAAEIAREYFARMRAGDIRVVELFHDDAMLVGMGQVTRGREAIRAFYTGAIQDGRPQPALANFLADDDKAFAEIDIRLGDGGRVHAVDLFEVEDGRIRKLTYFIADHPEV